MSAQQSPGILSLPIEHLSLILSHLDFPHLLTARLVCRAFSEVLGNVKCNKTDRGTLTFTFTRLSTLRVIDEKQILRYLALTVLQEMESQNCDYYDGVKLAIAYAKLGAFEKALHFTDSISTSSLGVSMPQWKSQALTSIAVIQFRAGQKTRAEVILNQAEEFVTSALEDSSDTTCMRYLALAQAILGKTEAARRTFLASKQRYQGDSLSWEESVSELSQIAMAEYKAGFDVEAQETLERAEEILKTVDSKELNTGKAASTLYFFRKAHKKVRKVEAPPPYGTPPGIRKIRVAKAHKEEELAKLGLIESAKKEINSLNSLAEPYQINLQRGQKIQFALTLYKMGTISQDSPLFDPQKEPPYSVSLDARTFSIV